MYLKRLEVKGFKSFADKIDLEFGKGITAVVGPNGSGKSNISDSVRWVLGEQSARTLRGAKMEDVIFAGTENRKSLGAAEVSLVIDNSSGKIPLDYSEITISRRLYRSGESEYLLNGTSCRLKDITEVFMDTGIGKDGYSLIGQGRIDEILSTRSEDRRNLFEEAAGIVKFKSRKLEAERKLENTKQNLLRISDIIIELEEQIEPLFNQSQTARKFLGLKEELKELEINVVLRNFEDANLRLDKLKQNIDELTESRDEMSLRKQRVLDELQLLKNELENIEKEYETVNIERIEIEKSHESKQGHVRLLNERHDNYINERERISDEIKNETKTLSDIETSIKKVTESKEVTESEVLELKKRIEEINLGYIEVNDKYGEIQRQIEDKKSEAIQMLKTAAEFNNRISSSQIIDTNLNSRKSQLDRDIELRMGKIAELEVEIDKSETVIKHLEEKLSNYRVLFDEGSNRLKELEAQEKKLKGEKDRSFEKLKMVEARYKALQDMEREMEGFNRAVKSVITRFKDEESVYGTISDLISVPKGFETAMEIALGPSIQNIVVDNEHTAGKMISFLKSNNLGRATFLPLTTIKSRDINQNIASQRVSGYLGSASEIVGYDSRFKSAISNLLGRVLVCDNLENARLLARKTDYSYRIVTLDGDVINSGGSFTGGSTGSKGSGVFTRKNEINELEMSAEGVKRDIGLIDEKINSNNRDIEELKRSLNNISQNVQQVTLEINNEKNTKAATLRERLSHLDYIKDMGVELQQIDMEKNKNKSITEEYSLKLLSLTEEQSKVEEIIVFLQNSYNEFVDLREKISSELTDRKVIFAERNKALEAISQNYNQLLTERIVHEDKIKKFILQHKELDEKLIELEEDIKSSISEIQKTAESIVEIKDKVFGLEQSKKEKNSVIGAKDKEIHAAEEGIKDLVNSVHKLEIAKSKVESDIEMLINKLWEDYEITIPQAEKYRKDIKNISESVRRVNELKNSIRSLGDVNVNSIEEYKRVTERYEFLKVQEHDLHKAEEALMDIIFEMTEKMQHQFEEKFKIIRQNFNETFKELFGGGYADLKLEEEDVLNSGIEIIVQPPGKKLQNLSLLSGGERGLAAIALIFAILKMKPTPFCVLDEIEAALDDANVNRYAEFLKSYSKNTQFIIITHRKGSMAASDALYGVTMEEKGVSKVISLKLKGGK